MRHSQEPLQGQLQSQYANVNGTTIHTRVSTEHYTQDTPTIVLVHGLMISSRYMVPLAKLLAPYYRVYAIDLPGYGKSDKPKHTLELPELADALCRWMDAVGIDRAILVGNSFGCQVIVEFAVRYPNRIERAILQAPTIDRHTRTFPQQLWRFLYDAPNENPLMTFLLLYDAYLAGIPRVIRTIQIALADQIEAKLPLVQASTLVVWAAKDPLVPEHWATEITDLLPKGKLIVVPKVGHAFNYSQPAELAEVIRAFVDAPSTSVSTV